MNWSELNRDSGDPHPSLDEIFDDIEPSKTYRFVAENLTLPLHDEENEFFRTLLISKGPIRNSKMHMGFFGIYSGITEKNYFALVVGPRESLRVVHLSPQTIEERYQVAGLQMPVPIEIPERIWVKNAKKSMMIRYAIYASAILLIAFLFYRRFRMHRQP